MRKFSELPNRQAWTPDTHPETIHTAWHPERPEADDHLCVGVHVHPGRAGRHFLATPAEHRLEAHMRAIPGATLHRIPDDHHVVLDPEHAERIYRAILAENQLKNRALATVEAHLPPEMRHQVTDADGDPIFLDENDDSVVGGHVGSRYMRLRDRATVTPAAVRPLMETKMKHRPAWSFDVATGKVSIRVPGADDALHAKLHRAAQAEHGPDVTVG